VRWVCWYGMVDVCRVVAKSLQNLSTTMHSGKVTNQTCIHDQSPQASNQRPYTVQLHDGTIIRHTPARGSFNRVLGDPNT
jgi:hypothetical protein